MNCNVLHLSSMRVDVYLRFGKLMADSCSCFCSLFDNVLTEN